MPFQTELVKLLSFNGAKANQKFKRTNRHEEGTCENGVFKFLRLLNGGQTDGGLDFSSEPLVYSASPAPPANGSVS